MQSTIYICICTYTNRYDCRDDPKCPPRLGCVLPSWCIFIFITAVLIYGLSHGPSKLHTLILSPGQYTRYNPIKSHNCHQRKGCYCLVANLPGEGINESESVGGGVGGDYDWIVEVWRMMQIISKINILARHQQQPDRRQIRDK